MYKFTSEHLQELIITELMQKKKKNQTNEEQIEVTVIIKKKVNKLKMA